MRLASVTLPLLSMIAALHWTGEALAQAETKTHEVKPEKFEIEVELSGVFAAEETTEISIEPESWSQYKVVEAVSHGAKVTAGQVLVRFDDEEINEAIEDMETDQQLADLGIMQAEEELPRLEKSLHLQLEAAERAHRISREDFERWQEIDRPLSLKSLEFSLKYYQQNLEYQQEELEQLEKMYAADELTEETEEIILKRQRNAVEQAQFSFELAENRHEEALKLQIPRTDASVKMELERAELNLAQAKSALEFTVSQKRFALEKSKEQRQESLKKHAETLADRELMTVKSPVVGVVYYGREVDGKWSGTQAVKESLKEGGTVAPKSVFMTIVQMRPLVVLANVTEKDVVEIDQDAAVSIVPTADEETQIAGKVADVSALPVGEGQFPLKVDVTGEVAEWVVPGMTCKVKVTTYAKEDALTVPAAAVRTDDEDQEKKYVLLHVEDADPERREVKVGKTHGGKTEILEGLAAGDKALLGDTKPQEKKAAEAEDEAASEQAESEEKEAAEESDEEQSSDEPEQAEQDSSTESADPSE